MKTTEATVKIKCEGDPESATTILNVLQTALKHYGNREAGRAYITFDERNEAEKVLRATVTLYWEE